MAIEVGQPAPDFKLPAEPGGSIQLSALRGRPVVLYFYPKDNTPGCTTEACDFRDRMARVRDAGAEVFGVSRDSLARHRGFREKYGLDFPLLTDADGAVHALFGAWGEKKMYGRAMIGPLRTTVLIDATGVVRQIWTQVWVKGHAEQVIAAVEAL